MIGYQMVAVDNEFDFEVKRLNRFLAILGEDVLQSAAASMYRATLDEEYQILKNTASKLVASEDGDVYIDMEVIEAFTDVLDEVKTFVAGCIIWE